MKTIRDRAEELRCSIELRALCESVAAHRALGLPLEVAIERAVDVSMTVDDARHPEFARWLRRSGRIADAAALAWRMTEPERHALAAAAAA